MLRFRDEKRARRSPALVKLIANMRRGCTGYINNRTGNNHVYMKVSELLISNKPVERLPVLPAPAVRVAGKVRARFGRGRPYKQVRRRRQADHDTKDTATKELRKVRALGSCLTAGEETIGYRLFSRSRNEQKI
ncbi:hypothetical protein MSG28_008107 [Choristoneura fumiferana]|uniref:Uncharacterized protein n=1 Tax=Choristoneura fumiferana TaxID=7141 RepID=A0ACC0JA46_CHOFU|nr:hypothetical protein MSG28_008107 [Choristoneura fumiferana]